MLYVIDGKCYVNISPSIYVEVIIGKNGTITPTKNKLEANASTVVKETTLNDWLKNIVETKHVETVKTEHTVGRKYNKRKK